MLITSNYLYVRLMGDRSIPNSEFGKITKNKNEHIRNWANKVKKHKIFHLQL